MKIRVWHSAIEGEDSSVICEGETEEELQKDVDLTLSRLGWDKRYCSTELFEKAKRTE